MSIIEFNADEDAPADREQETLFAANGTEYTIPARFTAGDTFAFLNTYKKFGLDAATDWALEYALGTEAYLVLVELGQNPAYERQFLQVVNVIVSKISAGNVVTDTDPKGLSPAASRPKKTRPAPRAS